MRHAVEIEGATKTFGQAVAVDDLSLSVPTGSVYGFIGPNGSGKTTTLRMIMRMMYPDQGRIHVLGEDIMDGAAASDRIGYLPEERGLYRKMKVTELLRFYGELKGLRDSQEHIDHWLKRMDLHDHGQKKIEALSKGMSQKVQFIATVLHRPELLLLDEPFSGLDPVNLDVLRDAVLELNRNGATVIFSTHDMSVAEQMCDFIFMIYRGRKVLDGTLDEIKQQYGRDTIRLRTAGAQANLDRLEGIEKITDFGRLQEVRIAERADPQHILQQVLNQGQVEYFEIAHPSLHDIFVRIAGPEPQENGNA